MYDGTRKRVGSAVARYGADVALGIFQFFRKISKNSKFSYFSKISEIFQTSLCEREHGGTKRTSCADTTQHKRAECRLARFFVCWFCGCIKLTSIDIAGFVISYKSKRTCIHSIHGLKQLQLNISEAGHFEEIFMKISV